MLDEREELAKCLILIEEKLGWGSSAHWQNQDFDAVRERIADETGVALSTSTLKRLWGKVHYDSAPTATTLNTLARFLGYENWREFRKPLPLAENQVLQNTEPISPSPPTSKFLLSRSKWIWTAVLFITVFLTGNWAFRNGEKRLEYGVITFGSRPVAQGLPNTVIFNYNAADSNADSVFIQQSWNPRLRFRVDKNNQHYTSTYYYPGYFRAKLVLNDSIVKEHDLYITTQGWLGTINRDSIPVYFNDRQIRKNAVVAVTETDLLKQGVDLQKAVPSVSLHYVKPMGNLSASNFTFETELKSTFNHGSAVCQQTMIMLLCSNGVHIMQLSAKGCVGELGLSFSDLAVSGKTNDLSGLGVGFTDWAKVRCEVKDKQVTLFVNGKQAYTGQFEKDPGKIVGVRYGFQGSGEVRSARFLGKEEVRML